MIVVRVLVFALGVAVVIFTLLSAIRSFVLPRAAPVLLTTAVFRAMRRAFNLWLWATRARTYEQYDSVLALYAPFSLLCMPLVWLLLIWMGYGAMYWSLGVETLARALRLSGSSLLTLGFDTVVDQPGTLLEFSEAALGLVMAALLISYLPTMYSAFSQRESVVAMLEVRAGNPPSAIELIKRYHRIQGFEKFNELWRTWEVWFVTLDETHTSLAPLSFYRSPRPTMSWVTAAGTILDAAALINAVVDTPHDPQADLCIRAGYLALRHIADFFAVPYNSTPLATDPISIARSEFNAACDNLAAAGVPLRLDRDAGWRSYAGWRVNYDTVLLTLALLTTAPPAPWISDRSLPKESKPFKLAILSRRPPEE